MDLKGKVAIVTGGGTGLGKEITLRLARAGANVAIVYSRSAQEARETAGECEALGVRALPVQADVSRDADVRAMVEQVKRELGRIDVLVNNAGTTIFRQLGDLESIDEEDWDRIMAVNVKAAFLCARAVVPSMREAGAGAIVSISSVAGLGVSGSSIPYGVSKAGLIHLTRWLARALAPQIRVNGVAPGLLRTTRWWGETPQERLDQYEQLAPLKRATGLGDTADAAMLAITNDSITGQTLVVDAGLLAR
jgi:3-oxoacyl-[acyl-carrier protein] reductase